MAFSLRSLAAVAIATASSGAAAATGTLYGVVHPSGDINTCSLYSIDLSTGVNTTVADVSAVCAGVTTVWPAFSAALVETTSSLVLLTSSAASIFGIDIATGETSTVAALPAYNESDAYLGMVNLAGGNSAALYVVNQYSGVSYASNGQLKPLGQVPGLPASGSVAGSPFGGTFAAGRLFVSDRASDAVTVISLNPGGGALDVAVLHTKVDSPMDMQYDAGTDRLILLADYVLYGVESLSGASTKIADVPNGPGFPRVNAITPDGATFVFIDFASVHVMDTTSGATSIVANFSSAPLVVGFPQVFGS